MNDTGRTIKQLRQEKGLNQKEFGDMINLSQTSVAHYEAGTREPNIETLKNISKVFSESIDVIVGNQIVDKKANKKYENTTELIDDLLDSLLIKNERLFVQLFQDHVIDSYPLEVIIEEIISVVLTKIGNLWYQGVITEADEHYATNLFRKIMSVQSIRNSDLIKDKTALSMSIGPEKHTLGIEMINTYIETLGVQPIYLGNSVKFKSIEKLLIDVKPDYVLLSSTLSSDINHLIALVEFIREKYPTECKIILGGQGLANKKTLEQYSNVHCLKSIRQLKKLL